MEKFESQEYRDQLAKQIRQTKSIQGTEIAKSLAESAQENRLYKISDSISKLKRLLPKEYVNSMADFIVPKNEELLAKDFDIEAISSKVTQEHRFFIELEILENLFLLHTRNSGEEYLSQEIKDKIKEIKKLISPDEAVQNEGFGIKSGPELFNTITQGEFFNNHNFSHIVTGQRPDNKYLAKPFSPDTTIEGSDNLEPPIEYFYVCPGANDYANQIDKPLVLFSSQDPAARSFVKSLLPEKLDEYLKYVSLYRDENGNIGYSVGKYGGGQEIDKIGLLLFLADYPIISWRGEIVFRFHPEHKRYQWNEVASEIVNIPAGRKYKRKISIEEQETVNKDIEYYRDLLKKNSSLHLDFERDQKNLI